MKRSAMAGLAAVVVAGVGGCAKRSVTPPPEAFVTLGAKTAPYRAWAQVDDLCAIDPEQFKREQDAMTALLADWLGQTSAAADGAWDDEHLALLEAGVRQLPAALAVQQAALAKTETAGCRFEGLGPARELNAQGRRRVADAEQLVPQVKARLGLAKWKAERPGAQEAARAQRCGAAKPKAGAPPLVYFAAEDEAARLEWHFCDGAVVAASPGNPPALATPPQATAPAPKKAKKGAEPKAWLDAAATWPAGEVSRAPKLPRRVTRRDDAAPEPAGEP
jgi:hypothetical protein